jgi:hypothetical protein
LKCGISRRQPAQPTVNIACASLTIANDAAAIAIMLAMP